MLQVASRVNELKRCHERVVHIRQLESRIFGWHGNDLSTLGDLILEVRQYVVRCNEHPRCNKRSFCILKHAFVVLEKKVNKKFVWKITF